MRAVEFGGRCLDEPGLQRLLKVRGLNLERIRTAKFATDAALKKPAESRSRPKNPRGFFCDLVSRGVQLRPTPAQRDEARLPECVQEQNAAARSAEAADAAAVRDRLAGAAPEALAEALAEWAGAVGSEAERRRITALAPAALLAGAHPAAARAVRDVLADRERRRRLAEAPDAELRRAMDAAIDAAPEVLRSSWSRLGAAELRNWPWRPGFLATFREAACRGLQEHCNGEENGKK